ncbi:HEAT repeat domain-containing protein [candidate division KSB1 bacterium]|nr:HEAT repeat domain-containing protein [candidate division KSB1 bacterium]
MTQLVLCSHDTSFSEEQVSRLVAKLGARDWEAAIDSLALIGKPAVQPIIELAQTNDASLDWPAARACHALAKIHTREAINVLSQIAQNLDTSKRRRRNAIEAIGLYNIKNKTDVLIKLLRDDDEYIADPAARSLAQIGTADAIAALLDILESHPHYICDRDIRRALVKDHADIVAHVAVTSLNTRYYWDWMSALDGLVEMGDAAGPTLMQNLNHEDALIRLRIIRILGKIGYDKAVSELVKALRDGDWMIRNEAAVALVKIASDKSIEQLKMLQRDPDVAYAHDDISWILERLANDEEKMVPEW